MLVSPDLGHVKIINSILSIVLKNDGEYILGEANHHGGNMTMIMSQMHSLVASQLYLHKIIGEQKFTLKLCIRTQSLTDSSRRKNSERMRQNFYIEIKLVKKTSSVFFNNKMSDSTKQK